MIYIFSQPPYVTCFPYRFLYHSMHYENIALQDGSQVLS